jgi:predicted nucleotidyltransferase component of viral defense system
MRALAQGRLDLIDALVAESDLKGITAGLLEKDEHLTDALRAVFALNLEHVTLVFCGGTSLSKAHALIERMSEDADIKVVPTKEAAAWGRSRLRNYLGEVREQVAAALTDLGFAEDSDKALSLNERRYLHSQWSYERSYAGASGLRPKLQLELVTRTPVLATVTCTLGTLADRLAGRRGVAFDVATVSIAETQAEKVLSFLRRFAQHRAGQMPRDWDTALVRHIYDVHCIHVHHPELIEAAGLAFAQLVEGDKAEFAKQQPDFAANAYGVLHQALAQSKADPQTRDEYGQNLLPLIYGDFKPPFNEAFTGFEQVAKVLLASVNK